MLKKICKAVTLIMCIGLLVGCGGPSRLQSFKTELSTEEHINNIISRTEEKYSEQLGEGTITAFQVYTLWSFKEKPEYFLVEFDGNFDNTNIDAQGFEGGGYAFLIGYIADDQYYMYYYYPRNTKSPFREQGFENDKKYYGYTTMAVKKDGTMVCIGNMGSTKDKSGATLSKSRQNYLATHDYRLPSTLY